jgi:hypothetical protein
LVDKGRLSNQIKLKRRKFIQNSIGLFGLTILPDAFSLPSLEKENLKLIRELEDFADNELGLNLKRKFYRKWQKKEQQLTYVYTSRPDSIILPKDSGPFKYFGTDTLAARIHAIKSEEEGLDAMVYNTSGTSATLLTHHLLNYPKEAIIFIVLHEMAHVHRDKSALKIPYPAEESFGEFLGNHASLKFGEKYYPELIPAIKKQRRIQEKIYQLLAEAETQVQGISKAEKDTRYQAISAALKVILLEANVFQKERYNYPVNNAYILRNKFYYQWYEKFKDIYLSGKSLKEMTLFYSSLPENASETNTFLKLELNRIKNNSR